MNWLDLILIIPLTWLGFKGFKKGLIIEVFSLLALLAGIYGGIHFSDFTSSILTDEFNLKSEYMPIIAFGVTFLLIVVGVYYVGKLLEKVVKIVALSMINKILGAAFGLVKGLLFVSLFLILIESINSKVGFIPRQVRHESTLYNPILKLTSILFPMIADMRVWEMIPEIDLPEIPSNGS